MQYATPSINHLHAVSINQYVLLGNWCVLNKYSFSLSFSFPFLRSFPSLSLCQKSTANWKSSSMLVWNTPKTYTSGTPAWRLSAFGLKFLPLLIKLMFSDYWNSKHSELVIAMYYTLPVPTSLIFCHYSLYLFITHTSKQTNRFPCLILSILTLGLCLITTGTYEEIQHYNTAIKAPFCSIVCCG